jgi:hypothetical protein
MAPRKIDSEIGLCVVYGSLFPLHLERYGHCHLRHSFNNDHVYFDIMKNVPPIFLGTAQKGWENRDPENAADVSVG